MSTFDAFCVIVAAFGLLLIFLDFCAVTTAIVRKKEYRSMCGDVMSWFHVHEFWWMPVIVAFMFFRGIILL